MSQPTTEVKQRWENANYKKYMLRFRVDDDAELISYIEANKADIGTTELMRQALTEYMENHK